MIEACCHRVNDGVAAAADDHVVEARELPEYGDVLKRAGDAEMDAIAGAKLEQRLAGEFDAAAIGFKKAGYDVEQRCLAGAVRADQPVNAARGHHEARGIDRVQRVEMLVDGFDKQQVARSVPAS